MVTAEGRAVVLLHHPALMAACVLRVLQRRWPSIRAEGVTVSTPCFEWAAEDAAALALCRRGVEPLRIVVLPQRARPPADARVASADREPMPFVLG